MSFEDNTLTIAMCDPQKLSIIDELRSFLGHDIKAMVCTEKEMLKALERYYSAGGESVETMIASMEQDAELAAAVEAMEKTATLDLTSVEALADSAPVRKLLNMVLLLAIKDRASDLHFEPFEHEFKIRIRADGVLYEMVPPPRHLAFAITTRIKVMADLDIAERRLPQDGRIRLNVGGHPVDLRVSVLPTMFGESVVMRILDRSVVMLDLDVIGMPEGILQSFREVIRKPNGIVLVTGPTGCGKTTTLYGALNELNVIEDKLITTEDPVEYDIDGIVQMPIDAAIGNTFAQCLRSILRQDPDKILVGEIRDLETAEIAVQASLTGHMVFSTLHTNDAPATVTRLARHGRAAVSDHGHAGGRLGPAAGAEDLQGVPRADDAQHGDAGPARPHARRRDRQEVLSRPRLSGVQQHRLQGTHRLVRVHAHERPAPRSDQPRRLDRGDPRSGVADRHGALAQLRLGESLRRHHPHRGSDPRNGAGRVGRETGMRDRGLGDWKRRGTRDEGSSAVIEAAGGITQPCSIPNPRSLIPAPRSFSHADLFSSRRWTPPARRSRTSSRRASQDEAQATIRQMGYFVTKIAVKKSRKTAAQKKAGQQGQDLRPRRREVRRR